LDGDLHHRGLLKFAVTQENLSDTCVLLVASMAQPWSLMESLEKWAEVLSTHIDRLKVAPEKRRNMEERCKSASVEPRFLIYGNTVLVFISRLTVFGCIVLSASNCFLCHMSPLNLANL